MPSSPTDPNGRSAAPSGLPLHAEPGGYVLERRIMPSGLHVEGRFYASPELDGSRRHGALVQVLIGPWDVSRVRAYLPDRAYWIEVPLRRDGTSGERDAPEGAMPSVAAPAPAWSSRPDAVAMSITAIIIAGSDTRATVGHVFRAFVGQCWSACVRPFAQSTFQRMARGRRRGHRGRLASAVRSGSIS